MTHQANKTAATLKNSPVARSTSSSGGGSSSGGRNRVVVVVVVIVVVVVVVVEVGGMICLNFTKGGLRRGASQN